MSDVPFVETVLGAFLQGFTHRLIRSANMHLKTLDFNIGLRQLLVTQRPWKASKKLQNSPPRHQLPLSFFEWDPFVKPAHTKSQAFCVCFLFSSIFWVRVLKKKVSGSEKKKKKRPFQKGTKEPRNKITAILSIILSYEFIIPPHKLGRKFWSKVFFKNSETAAACESLNPKKDASKPIRYSSMTKPPWLE